jgi:hypothetical protein
VSLAAEQDGEVLNEPARIPAGDHSSLVKPSIKPYFVRYFVAKRSNRGDELSSIKNCFALRVEYRSEPRLNFL